MAFTCQKIPPVIALRLLLPASHAGAVSSGHVGLCFPASSVHSTAFPSIKDKKLQHITDSEYSTGLNFHQ